MDLSRELGIADGVRFRGALSHPEVLALHQEVDLLVQSSWSEGFPKAVAEALLMGTVVAMSTTSSHSAVWLDRGIGLGFAPSSPQGLADAISSAAGPSVAVEQISAGRTWARTVTIERYQGHVSSLVSGECAAPDPS
jgi:glycosyltransferase involved in cell wall biosynthesis